MVARCEANPGPLPRPRQAWKVLQLMLRDANHLRALFGEAPLRMTDVHHLTWWEFCETHLWPLEARAREERSAACG